MSLRIGAPIATAEEPIINPHNLKILGWWCKDPETKDKLILLADEVREIMPGSLAVNDQDALSEPEDLVRHREILEIHFKLHDKLVRTKRQRLGKVSDYSYNEGLFVQKLYVQRSLMKVFSAEDMLIVDRTQILEVTDRHILVRDVEIKATESSMAPTAEPALP